MSEERLRELARKLDSELETAATISKQDRELLGDLMQDISRVVGETENPSGIRERARDAIEHFENEHPTITLVLKQVLDTLERIGI